MKLPEKEKAAQRAAFRAMSPAKKAEHIFTYYKWPILLGLLALLILGSAVYRQFTKKEPVLYLALVNVAPGEQTERSLTADYLAAAGHDARKREVYLYPDLYLSDEADTINHEYAYASKMKLTGAISAQKLDLALMNREAYDIFSAQGFLLELSELPDELSPLLTENDVVVSDNSVDVLLGNAQEERRVTKSAANALAVSTLPLFRDAVFDGELYLGVLANSPRQEESLAYLRYVSGRP